MFTERGAIMAAMVLGSPCAVEVSVCVVRAFVRLRDLAVLHMAPARRLSSLMGRTEALAMSHDTVSRNAHNQLRQVFEASPELTPPDSPKRPIGFVTPEDKSKGSEAVRGKKAG